MRGTPFVPEQFVRLAFHISTEKISQDGEITEAGVSCLIESI